MSYKELKSLIADLEAVYAAVDDQAVLDTFEEHWDKKHPKIPQSWWDNWANISTYFKYPQEVRRLICTTNAVEGFNRQLHKVTKAKWPSILPSVCPSNTAGFPGRLPEYTLFYLHPKWSLHRIWD